MLSFVTYQHVFNNTCPNQVFLKTLRRLKGSTSLMREQNDVAMIDKLLLHLLQMKVHDEMNKTSQARKD